MDRYMALKHVYKNKKNYGMYFIVIYEDRMLVASPTLEQVVDAYGNVVYFRYSNAIQLTTYAHAVIVMRNLKSNGDVVRRSSTLFNTHKIRVSPKWSTVDRSLRYIGGQMILEETTYDLLNGFNTETSAWMDPENNETVEYSVPYNEETISWVGSGIPPYIISSIIPDQEEPTRIMNLYVSSFAQRYVDSPTLPGGMIPYMSRNVEVVNTSLVNYVPLVRAT